MTHWAITPVTTGASTQEPVTVSEQKIHMRFVSTSDDTAIASKISAGRRMIEDRTRRPYIKAQFDQMADCAPSGSDPITLQRWPAVSVESITSYGTTGGATVLSTGAYFLDSYSEPPRVCLNSGYTWPTGTRDQVAMVVRFTAGYTSDPATGIPDPLLEAVRKLATELYVNRESVSIGNSVNEPLPYGVEDLVAPYTMPEFG